MPRDVGAPEGPQEGRRQRRIPRCHRTVTKTARENPLLLYAGTASRASLADGRAGLAVNDGCAVAGPWTMVTRSLTRK
jgi:hypothetical protein